MGLSDFSLTTTWVFWILVIVLIWTIAFWCHGVNKKLHYILGRFEKMDRRRDEANSSALKQKTNTPADRSIPTLVGALIIGVAILILFVIPLWFINR